MADDLVCDRIVSVDCCGMLLEQRPPNKSPVALGYPNDNRTEDCVVEPATSIAWLSLRPEHRLPPGHCPPEAGASGLRHLAPLRGLICIAFGIGANGVAWLNRLGASEWFSGLEPLLDVLSAAGGPVPAGCVTIRIDAAGRATNEIEAVLAHTIWAAAPVVAVAISGGSGLAEQFAALGLVSALRTRQNARGCRAAVIVTLEGLASGNDAFASELLNRGAFVVRAGSGAEGDHFHHFPLRASVYPRRGRLVCADLADYVACWPSCSFADLHVIAMPLGPARKAVDRLASAYSRAGALNVDLHPDLDDPGNSLAQLDQLATHCRERFLSNQEGNFVFTSSERLDGKTGMADILVVAGPYSFA